MKKFFILIALFLVTTNLFASAYVVVYEDGETIHTVEERPHEVLKPGWTRHTIDKWSNVDNECNYWNDSKKKIEKRPQAEIREIKRKRRNFYKKYQCKRALIELDVINELERETGHDFSKEKAKWQKVFNDNKNPESEVT